MGLGILFIIALVAELIWSPRLDYIEQSSVLILFYGGKNTRKRKIFKL